MKATPQKMYFGTKWPGEVLNFGFNWTNWLDGDTIATSVWDVPNGLTNESDTETTTLTTVFISGGTKGKKYEVSNTITTAGGLTAIRKIIIEVL